MIVASDLLQTDAAPARPPHRLAEIVYEQVFRLIARGEFPRDCKLPSEGDLSVRFGVSRPVIRDALARLKSEGYVRSQRGSGTVVVRGEAAGARRFPPIRTIGDLLRCYEFRITVETATAAQAAIHRTAASLAAIERTLDEAQAAMDTAAHHLLTDLNFAFHRAVAGATGNPFYVVTLDMIPNFVGREPVNASAFGESDAAERRDRVHAEHVLVWEAIRDRDPARARAEMERHIATARDYVLERQEVTSVRERLFGSALTMGST